MEMGERLRRLRGCWREWRRAPARAREFQEEVFALRASNHALIKGEWRDRARIDRLERELALEKVAAWATVPGLTPAEIERLGILAGECGAVAQAVSKVLRFGWESQSPYGGRLNRHALEREIGNLRAIVNLMLDVDDVRLSEVQTWQRTKRLGLAKWTLYQSCSMPREEQLRMMQAIADGELR